MALRLPRIVRSIVLTVHLRFACASDIQHGVSMNASGTAVVAHPAQAEANETLGKTATFPLLALGKMSAMPRLGLGPQLRRGTVRRREQGSGPANNGRESATSSDLRRVEAKLDSPPLMPVNLGLGPQISSLVAEEGTSMDLPHISSGTKLRGTEAVAFERSWLLGYMAEMWGRQYLLVACILALVAFFMFGPNSAPRCTPPGKAKFLAGMRWHGRAPSP
mmetsp:Transcript_100450/g.199442  ORF Transcript_100450/g.199442 Transcript_100450/m.199442 type:complete len:220 (-) Transcript_100450:84-743(-)